MILFDSCDFTIGIVNFFNFFRELQFDLFYRFSSDYAESLFKAWNIQVRLAWDISPMTHTLLVEGYFYDKSPCLRNQIFSRYPKFVK